mmetsp:Transcript_54617/g.95491  ORF Transcript_54617/g.95491 Transcript_54617/m.95491 type:complete len:209 (-) Transcript_54617:521-1147(-)
MRPKMKNPKCTRGLRTSLCLTSADKKTPLLQAPALPRRQVTPIPPVVPMLTPTRTTTSTQCAISKIATSLTNIMITMKIHWATAPTSIQITLNTKITITVRWPCRSASLPRRPVCAPCPREATVVAVGAIGGTSRTSVHPLREILRPPRAAICLREKPVWGETTVSHAPRGRKLTAFSARGERKAMILRPSCRWCTRPSWSGRTLTTL